MADELVTTLLFLLMGFEILAIPLRATGMATLAAAILLSLAARFVSVAVPLMLVGRKLPDRGRGHRDPVLDRAQGRHFHRAGARPAREPLSRDPGGDLLWRRHLLGHRAGTGDLAHRRRAIYRRGS